MVALLPPGNMKVRFFVSEAMLPRIALDDTINIQCDGCPSGLTARVSFIARTAEFTPPVIYSLEERNKLVFMVEALPEKPESLRVGQPVSVTLVPREQRNDSLRPTSPSTSRGLSKSFGNRKVVRDLSMQVKRGTIYGFLGPNGSGKTTTIRMLTGLLTPDEGEGTCLGFNIRTQADEIKRHVGYMTQRFSLYQDLSVRENLEFVARLYGIDNPVAAARAMVERLGLTGREEQLAGELSGGWKQRLALGACTLPNPQLLLLDEPTAGVDPKARREFWNEIHALAATGLTVLVSTHYMDEAERCHEIAYIAYGVLLAHGTVPEVIAARASRHLHRQRAGYPDADQARRRAYGPSRRRHGGAVRIEPARVGPRPGGARCRDRELSRALRSHLDAFGRDPRGRVHRPDEPGAGQFPMTVAQTEPGRGRPAAANSGGAATRCW